MSRQCGLCGPEKIKARAEAVYYLLSQPNLTVFNKLIVEEALAAEVLGMAEKEKEQEKSQPATISGSSSAEVPPPGNKAGSKQGDKPPQPRQRSRHKRGS